MTKRQILKWTLIGLLIRLLIMPFFFQGSDIFSINYPVYESLKQKILDPYLLLKRSFPGKQSKYYPPAVFLINLIFLFLFKPFLPKLQNLFAIHKFLAFGSEGNTINYADILTESQLFQTLFIFKIPYLIFDFGIGWFIFQILKSDNKKALLAYKLWMLNPFVLHGCYALGQFDIITTFFVMAAIYCIYKNRRYFACGLLSFGILTKIFPVFLIPFVILILGNNFKEKIKLLLAIIIPMFVVLMPFYISSKDAIFETLFVYSGKIPLYRYVSFMVGYIAILSLFFFIKRKDHFDLDFIISSFILVLLLFYSLYIVTIRYFILITPLLIYIACRNRAFWVYNIIFFLSLFELRACGNSQQWGLLAALHPEFFTSLPILDSYINLVLNVKYIHQAMYILFFISSLTMIAHIFWLNRNYFRFSFVRPLKNEKK